MNPITLENLTPELREFLERQSSYFRLADFASPYACAFAEELYERGKRDALYPGGNQEAACLAFEARLAQFHAAVWEAAADEDGSTAYDEAGVDLAKLICRSYRSMAASYGEALSERVRKTKRIVDMQRENTRLEQSVDNTEILLNAACKEREELRAERDALKADVERKQKTIEGMNQMHVESVEYFQSELTKARKLLSQVQPCNNDYVAVPGGWFERRNTFLAHQSAPAAKCSRCEASTVENCDEKGCGYLGAGNGAPADTGVYCTAHVDYAPETKVNCDPCKGKGEVFCHDMEDGWYEKCNQCGGTGKVK